MRTVAQQRDDLLFAPGVPKIRQPKIEVERISEAQRAAALPRLEASFVTGTPMTNK